MCPGIQMKVILLSTAVEECMISSMHCTSGFEEEGSWSEWREES